MLNEDTGLYYTIHIKQDRIKTYIKTEEIGKRHNF